jgi:Tol biopolymer transport system component
LDLPTGVELNTSLAQSVAVSPDGTRVAFVGVVGGVRQLYVRRLDQFDAVAIRGTENASQCFFSPDGLAIAFFVVGVLKKVTLADGLVVTLSHDVDVNLPSAAWGTNDRLIYTHAGTLWQVPASGAGPSQQLTKLADGMHEIRQAWPTVVAGGHAILFTSVTGSSRDAMHIEALSLATGQRQVVVDPGGFPLYASSGHLIYFHAGALLAAPFNAERLQASAPVQVVPDVPVDRFGAPLAAISSAGALVYPSNGTASQLVWVSRQGVEKPLTTTARRYTNPVLSPDGQRVVVSANGELWIADIARPNWTRLTSDETLGTWPVWMPDGTRVVFRASTGLRWIYTDGSGRSKDIPGTTTADIPTSISSDYMLAFNRQSGDTSQDIEVLSLRGEAHLRDVVKTPAFEGGAQFSPDGRWMAYSSDVESGQMEVYIRPLPSLDRAWKVSTQGGRGARWSRNGKELLYRSGNKMMKVDMMKVDVGAAGSELTFSPQVLFEQRYAYGPNLTIANYDVSRDGEHFVMVKDESGSGRLNVVLNWFDELRRLVPTH